MNSDAPLRVQDKDNVWYYAFCDEKENLICLLCTEHVVPWGSVLDVAYAVLDNNDQLYAVKSNWNLAEWNTWFAFELCPAAEIIQGEEAWGIADEIRYSWDWRRIKP